MDIFRHIRENHLTEIKQLKIKIGQPNAPAFEKRLSYRKPGPKSKSIFRTRQSQVENKKKDEVMKCSMKVGGPEEGSK